MMLPKIPNTSGLDKKTDYDVKITEFEGKIPSITGLPLLLLLMLLKTRSQTLVI